MRHKRLFEELDSNATQGGQRAYIEEELVKLAKQRTLVLTEVLNQPEPALSLAMQVCMGHRIDPAGNCQAGVPIPPELRDYRVKIRAINGHKIRFKRPMVPDVQSEYWRGRASAAIEWFREDYFESDESEVELPLDEAILALRWAGRDVKRVRNAAKQKTYWHFEEVAPQPLRKVA